MSAQPEGWQIRGARQQDAAEIARLASVLGYPSDAPAVQGRLGELLAHPDHRIVVAAPIAARGRGSADAKIGGWMHEARHLTLESGEFAEILGLIVDPAARRTGLGRLLVAEAERWARVHRLARLTVRSNVARAESHAFYPALGFTQAKTQRVYTKALGPDAGPVA
ncbi:MAG TPA: GNAT family N-acetyltransferase [Steroidobacteraceae bacterium]|nr:GNAT family N-acetyltransferase [Steroidobacteraceae bacterium]